MTPEVGVDEAIPHNGHRPPLHLRRPSPVLVGQLLRGFLDHFQAPRERVSQRLVGFECLEAQAAAATDQAVGLGQDERKAFTRLEGHPPLRPGCGDR